MRLLQRHNGLKKCKINIFCLVLITIPQLVIANTIISGIQSGILTANSDPYIVTDDIIIPQGLTLTIEPGVVIKFSGPFRFIVAGALIARGTLANRIIFTSSFDTDFGNGESYKKRSATSSDWYGIDFTDTSDDYLNIINYSIIRYCKYGIRCRRAYPLLTHIVFADINNSSLTINNTNAAIQSGVDSDYLTINHRSKIKPVPEPPPESEEEKQKRIEKERNALLQQAREDSIRKARKIKPIDTKCGILVYDKGTIERFSFDSFPEILSFLPGFINMASYGEESILTCRGIFPGQFNNRILFLLNGVPLYDGITNSNFYEYIPINTVERIEIKRGPDGAFLGKNAFAGTINIITKQTEQPVKMSTATEWGSFYTKKLTSHIGINKGIFNICIGTSYRDDNGYKRTMNPDERGNKFLLNYENDNYNLLISSLSKNLNLVGSYYKRKHYQFGIIPIQQYSGLAEREGLLVSLNYFRKINKDYSAAISARYNKTTQQSEAGELGVSKTATNPPNFTITKGSILQTEVQLTYLSKKYPTSVGFSIEREKANSILSLLDEKNGDELDDFGIDSHPFKNEFSIFATSGYNLSPFIGCIGGLRWSYLGKGSDYFVSPTIRWIYNPFASYKVQLSYQHGYRSPSLWERQIKIDDILYSADKQMPEQIRSLELEFEYQISNVGELGFSTYQENISNLIQQRPLTAEEMLKYNASAGYILDNSDVQYQVIGSEINFQGRISKDISMFVNGAYQQLKDNSNNHILRYWPNIIGNVNFNYQYNSDILGSVYFQYIGKQVNEVTETTISPCYLLNFKIALNILSNVSLEIVANNLLDEVCFYTEFNRRKIPSIPGGYPRAFYFLLKTEF